MNITPVAANTNTNDITLARNSQAAVIQYAASELVFAVVGHVGAGTSTVANALQALLQSPHLEGGAYDVQYLKAKDIIRIWAEQEGKTIPDDTAVPNLDAVEAYQNFGDEMRNSTVDNTAVAKRLIGKIRQIRAQQTGVAEPGDAPVRPDGRKRAYILDSIRHPAEVELLRHVYQDAFFLIGVVCEEEKRLRRVMSKYANAGEANAKLFMQRDAKAAEKHGQRVSDAFHLSDFFLDNTLDRIVDGQPNAEWDINEKLGRLIRVITHSNIVRPNIAETAMYHAYAAAMQSACLSRQVGAALIDAKGNVIATGTNEVPQAGGGVYGERFAQTENYDHRCAFRQTGTTIYCSNTKEQSEIVNGLINSIPELSALDAIRKKVLHDQIKRGRIGDLLEFSRAVHAEMDAVLSAGREGISTIGSRLFVTTFPCHYCARHIVSAGIDEVQFIEPYPKSQALGLHKDAIQLEPSNWTPPSVGGKKVLFRPFVGVAPRLYCRAFAKDRELKNSQTGELSISSPEWGTPWHLRAGSYAELEVALFKQGNG